MHGLFLLERTPSVWAEAATSWKLKMSLSLSVKSLGLGFEKDELTRKTENVLSNYVTYL